jgi:hypothetical protein
MTNLGPLTRLDKLAKYAILLAFCQSAQGNPGKYPRHGLAQFARTQDHTSQCNVNREEQSSNGKQGAPDLSCMIDRSKIVQERRRRFG